MKKSDTRFKEVFQIALPLCMSYIPIGLACGVLLNAAGFNFLMTGLVSLLVFSGGAQFMIASMLTIHAPMQTILLMLLFLEMRYALLGSSLSQYVRGTSKKFLLVFAASMNDENYAVNYLKFATDKTWTAENALLVEHLSLLFWTLSNLVGSLAGGFISVNLTIVDFALTALFIYMIVMQIKNKLTILISILSGIVAVLTMVWLKSTMGLVVATLIASLIGFALEDQLVKKGKTKGFWLKKIKPNAGRKEISKSGD
ncbi:branched-chain amino acid ABC transporter [Ligilactobacillus pabuli]|uniref:Branched-chain amino acid ABC transporter n=2 Tax=Ligilactobacillus pabuli TaxID=2886039 RepID=A0ABQ5JK05_9LACO|nr:AzlC family ABC transporter permease [Ligilactobacillus pabuli]GKS82431.1 branched-chain amino acid ABC transporter [Ligilactobacillus pabuli]